MTKNEMKLMVRELLTAGTPKSQVFAQLRGKGIKDKHLAFAIASYADPIRCSQHDHEVNVLITIMFVQALIGFLLGYYAGAEIGPNAKWILAIIIASIPLLFAWGFYMHRVTAFHVYIVLTMVQMPNVLKGFSVQPVATTIALVINLSVLAYVYYLRDKLFPDFAFISPKKLKGEYKFSS